MDHQYGEQMGPVPDTPENRAKVRRANVERRGKHTAGQGQLGRQARLEPIFRLSAG